MQLISPQSRLQVFSDVHSYKELQLNTVRFSGLIICFVLGFFSPEVNWEYFVFEFLPFFLFKI